MACFVVPMTVAIFTTIFSKRISQKYHIEWLNMLLWGGSFMLAIEHYAHGEIVPFFPFLTAATEGPEAIRIMLMEMATIGSAMLLACVGIWFIMLVISPKIAHWHPQQMYKAIAMN
jgi:hypothetical protein